MQNAGKYSLDREWFPYFRDQPLDEDIPTNNTVFLAPPAPEPPIVLAKIYILVDHYEILE